MSFESRTTFTGGQITVQFHAFLRDRYGTPEAIADLNGRLTVEMGAEGDPVVSVSVYDGGVLSAAVREIIARTALRELKGDLTIYLANAADTYTDPARVTAGTTETQGPAELVPMAVEGCIAANAVIVTHEAAKAYPANDPHGDGVNF